MKSDDTKPAVLSAARLAEIREADASTHPLALTFAGLDRRALLARLDALHAGPVPDGEALGRMLHPIVMPIGLVDWERLDPLWRASLIQGGTALYTRGRAAGRAEGEAAASRAAAEVKGMDLGRFAYEAWAACATEQDASVRYLPWGDIGPDKRARWCRSAVSTYERAQAHMRGATPPPRPCAALLARVEEARRGAATKASNTVGASGANFQDGKAAGLREAASLIRATLGAPAPLDAVVAEVLASPIGQHAAIEIKGAGDAIEVIGELHSEREADTDRSLLLSIARVALAGMLACDAAKGGDK